MMNYVIGMPIVYFINETLKQKYKRKETKKHCWNNKYYGVLKFESFSETSEGQVVLCNDVGEIWWVSNRDVRIENIEEFVWDGKLQ